MSDKSLLDQWRDTAYDRELTKKSTGDILEQVFHD